MSISSRLSDAVGAGAAIFLAAVVCTAAAEEAPQSNGTRHLKSHHSVEKTIERAKRILEHNEFRVFGVIDHGDNAKQAGLDLKPTRLLVFGNPKGGTALMKENRLIALDLPMKLLIWEDKNGVVWISYNDPDFLKKRHGLYPQRALFNKMRGILEDISVEAGR